MAKPKSRKSANNNVVSFGQRAPKICEVVPRTKTQNLYFDYLMDDTNIVFGLGSAGTGKTYLAVKAAIKQFLSKKYSKIIITRPAVETGKSIGYLPGDLYDKMLPFIQPIIDIFEEVWSPIEVKKMFHEGFIEISPLSHMRGRTMKSAIVILDEAQNCTPDEIKMFLTRIGDDSKLILTGDITQNDMKGITGLEDFINRYHDIDGIEIVKFNDKDCIRHPLIPKILDLYKD